MFHEGDLQSGIGLAVQESKAVLCFIQDGTEAGAEWESILEDESLSSAIATQTVALRLEAGSQEAGFLNPIAPISSTPAVLIIKNAQVQANIQSAGVSPQEFKSRLLSFFGLESAPDAERGEQEHPEIPPVNTAVESVSQASDSTVRYLDLQPAPGQMRLPNNAYDALRNHSQTLLDQGKSHSEIFEVQLSLLNNISIFHEEVARLRASSANPELSEYARSRLLRLPAVGLKIPGQTKPLGGVSSSSPRTQPQFSSSSSSNQPSSSAATPSTTQARPAAITNSDATPENPPPIASQSPVGLKPDHEKQKAQRAEYIKMQREREQKARDERDRVKAQIKADREERRRLDNMRKGIMPADESTETTSSTYARSQSRNTSQVRIQVRTFDGSTLRSSFSPSSTLSADVRPWIDSTTQTTVPYNLKLILTPSPIRNIEASEEEQELSDLGIVGSCTLVMAPVKGYVESYTGNTTGGLLGSAVSGGYNLVSGTAGMVFGGFKNILGYGQPSSSNSSHASGPGAGGPTPDQEGPKVRVRTLADQRAEADKRANQFYNGNQLNFEPKKKDEEDRGKKD